MNGLNIEEFQQAIQKICNGVALFIERIKSFLSRLRVAARKYIKVQADIKRTKLIRQSWVMKQDTCRGSQVLCNKPRAHIRKLLY
ncbi:hypothetical protein [Priestia flexa]|uniref:hypothetical protein n=1 Tax=Priestia flexa TaxID=86664 RepID=UPI001CFF07EF|nr:hypothetical protein [Priestia flexa]